MKILDLARNIITLAGFQPDEDIEIRSTGPRPGEKLFEELSFKDENTLATGHSKIRIFRGPKSLMLHSLVPWITELQHLLWRRDPEAILAHLRLLVPEYQPQSQITVADSGSLALKAAPNTAIRAVRTAAARLL